MLNRDELLIDLKGAARLGSPEALDLALEGLAAWEAFAANARLEDKAVVKVLVPLGEVLAAPTVPADYLRTLADHPLAGGRALAAAALALRVLRGETGFAATLTRLAGDKRAEVRLVASTALARHGSTHFAAAEALLKAWLQPNGSPRLLATALQAATALATQHPRQILALLQRLTPQQYILPEAQRPLSEALKQTAAAGESAGVLALLAAWVEAANPPTEAILRALHANWARQTPAAALQLLAALEAAVGDSRPLRRTREFLEQNNPTEGMA